MTCTNELMKINVTAKDKQNKRTASGSKKMPESLNFEIDLTALTGSKHLQLKVQLFKWEQFLPQEQGIVLLQFQVKEPFCLVGSP